jgi:hypothetical protein
MNSDKLIAAKKLLVSEGYILKRVCQYKLNESDNYPDEYDSDSITAVLAVASDKLRRDRSFWDEKELAELVDTDHDTDWNVADFLLWTLEEIRKWDQLKTDDGRILSPKEAKSIKNFICDLPDDEAIELILKNKPRYYQHFYDQIALALDIAKE